MSEGLRVQNLVVRYGGHTAVDGVSIHAPAGRLTALIGPNGAGKTTIFNACSGLLTPAAGTVGLFGDDVTNEAAPRRARHGLGRTFQRMQLFDSLSVADNVGLAVEAALAGANPLRHLLPRASDAATVREAVHSALDDCRISHLDDALVGSLSTGQRRVVELARVLAGPFRLLLLDEPSSGLDPAESKQFGDLLRRVVDERGVGVLLVEHDMNLVLEVSDWIWVLDFGRLIAGGDPSTIRESPAVRAAYLGQEVGA